jgi:type II secretory pathway pseudopilin PulG
MVSRTRGRARRSQGGYNLVILAVLLTIMNVMAAAALPLWSSAIKRDQEEELIFRGFQYAEAIRVFQRRFGRYPVRLEELIETQPRSIRRLWKDPMTEDGAWGIVYADEGEGGVPPPDRDNPDGRPPEGEEDPAGEEGAPPQPPRVGPIAGVFSKSNDESIQVLFGQQRYRDWKFTVSVFGVSGIGPGGAAPAARSLNGLGRPFRHDVTPPPTVDPEGRGEG